VYLHGNDEFHSRRSPLMLYYNILYCTAVGGFVFCHVQVETQFEFRWIGLDKFAIQLYYDNSATMRNYSV